MPITINLKQLEYIDGDNLKLDKVNYNFDQLVANGGGPQGSTGHQGTMGYQGSVGYQGDQGEKGDQGYQGPQGSAGETRWVRLEGAAGDYTADTLLPADSTEPGVNEPTVVKLGFISTDDEYDSESPITSSGQLPAQFIVNRKSYFDSNISLTAEGISDSYEFKLHAEIDASGTNVITTLTQGFSLPTSTSHIRNHAGVHNFVDSSRNILITVTSGETTINTDTFAEEDVFINGDLSIKTTWSGTGAPDAGKIATAHDGTGKISFKTVREIGAGIPIGTIVGILPTVFESEFIQEQLNYDTSGGLIQFEIGKGTGDYVGWYLCNGQTWKNGTTNYQVPDLNKFNYNVQDNTDTTTNTSQGGEQKTDSKEAIIGGSDIEMTATFATGNIYNITTTKDFTEDLVEPDTSGIDYSLKKLPQIIYLGDSNFIFEIPGTPSPTYTNTYTFNFVDNATYPGIAFQPSQSFTVNAQFGALLTPQQVQLGLQAPTGYRFTGSGYDLGWTLPTGVTIQSGPTYGGTGNSTNGWSEVQYTFVVSQQLQNQVNPIYINFEADMAGALTQITTVAQKYVAKYSPRNVGWNQPTPATQTITAQPGDANGVSLTSIVFTAKANRYFDVPNTPILRNAWTGANTYPGDFGNVDRTGDFTATYTLSNLPGGNSVQPTILTFNVTDNDFANSSVNSAGLPANTETYLDFDIKTYATVPSSSPSGGGTLFNAPLSVNSPVSQTVSVTNETNSTIYVAIWLQNFTNSANPAGIADINAAWGSISTSTSGNENQTQNSRSNLLAINNNTSVSNTLNVTSFDWGVDQTWNAKLMWTNIANPAVNPWDPNGMTIWNNFL